MAKKQTLEAKLKGIVIEHLALAIQDTYRSLGQQITYKKAKTRAVKLYETREVTEEFDK